MPRIDGKLTPGTIAQYLSAAAFPARKEDLLEYAQDNELPDDVIWAIERIPDREFGSVADVAEWLDSFE